jgi:hypothetical protein
MRSRWAPSVVSFIASVTPSCALNSTAAD